MDENKNFLENKNEFLKSFGFEHGDKDLEIDDVSVASNYLNFLTENIKENNRKLTRNSFGIVLSFTAYMLIYLNLGIGETIDFIFIEIKNRDILLNFIPICFAFFFCKNIAILMNIELLKPKFDLLCHKVYKIGKYSKTSNFIKPFLFYDHILTFITLNNKLSKIIKYPIRLVLIIVLVLPIVFQVWTIFVIFSSSDLNFISYLSASIIIILIVITFAQFIGYSLIRSDYLKAQE